MGKETRVRKTWEKRNKEMGDLGKNTWGWGNGKEGQGERRYGKNGTSGTEIWERKKGQGERRYGKRNKGKKLKDMGKKEHGDGRHGK